MDNNLFLSLDFFNCSNNLNKNLDAFSPPSSSSYMNAKTYLNKNQIDNKYQNNAASVKNSSRLQSSNGGTFGTFQNSFGEADNDDILSKLENDILNTSNNNNNNNNSNFDDEVFANITTSSSNSAFNDNNVSNFNIEAIKLANLYKKLLIEKNVQDNNNNSSYYDNNNNNGIITSNNNNNNNNLLMNSNQSAFDTKPRHHSLMANNNNNKYFTNSNTNANIKNDNIFNFSSLNNTNDYCAKKRTNSFSSNNNPQSFNSFPVYSSLNNDNNQSSSIQQANTLNRLLSLNNNSLTSQQQQQQQLQQQQRLYSNPTPSTILSQEFLTTPSMSSLQSTPIGNNQLAAINNSKPLRSERLPSQFIDEIIKQAKIRRKNGGKKEVCVFCRNNGEREVIYTSHTLKDSANRVSCPILRLYQCPICHASADNAHTIKYCPYADNNNGSIKLFKDSRMNTAVLLMNSVANQTPSSSPSPPIQNLFNKQQTNFNGISIGNSSSSNSSTNSSPLSFAQAFNNIASSQSRSLSDSSKSFNSSSILNSGGIKI